MSRSSVPSTAPLVSSPRSPVADLLADLGSALEARGLRWYLFGAQAAILHGVARLTADVDVTVEPGDCSSAELVARLDEAGFELRVADADGFVAVTRVLPFVHRRSRIPVDVVLAGPGLEELFLSRVEPRLVGGVSIPVASAEDLVTMKILAGRAKDLEDALIVVRTRGPALDVSRIRETVRLLEQALDRADLLPELDRVLSAGLRPEGR
jgi:hypothetical protein